MHGSSPALNQCPEFWPTGVQQFCGQPMEISYSSLNNKQKWFVLGISAKKLTHFGDVKLPILLVHSNLKLVSMFRLF